MKKRLIAAVAALSMLLTGIGFADTDMQLSAFNSQTVIDGHVFENARLQYPFLYGQDTIYMPLDYQTLRTLGYLSSWDDSNNAFRIYTSTNKTYNLSTSEVKWSDALISAVKSSAALNWMDEDSIENSLIEANGILYLELNDETLSRLDWAAAYHPFLGLQMSVVEGSADLIEVNSDELSYYDGLARFMMTRNKDLSYEKAAEYTKYVKDASRQHDIDEIWIMAMLWQESWYDENCEYKGALGLMQIMESTGRALGLTREQLFDPQISIEYGAKYLRDQMNAFNNDINLATLAYNQGPVRVKKGTYKTWYLDQVKEKVAVITSWLSEEGVLPSETDEDVNTEAQSTDN